MNPYEWSRFEGTFFCWRRFALGGQWVSHAEQRDEGFPYLGWELTLYLGPLTWVINGKEHTDPYGEDA